ncbi:MAG TPA: CAP domain-containing protein [Candidatus Saccharimonadales bacterium]|nr:CAP domain-containing protein [Candidatus Saccharimonadales bacterium]
MIKTLVNRSLLAVVYKFHKASILLLVAVGLSLALLWPSRAFAMSADTLVALTNQQRQEQGLAPLHIDPKLVSSAHAKASDMFANNYWSHNSPSGVEPWYFIQQSNYKYIRAGENLAKDFQSDEAVMEGWMNSPSHRKNILNPDYQDIGIAVEEGQLLGAETTLIVAHYGATAAPRPAAAPAPVVTTAAAVQPVQPTPAPQPAPVATVTPQPAVKSATSEVSRRLSLKDIIWQLIVKPTVNIYFGLLPKRLF